MYTSAVLQRKLQQFPPWALSLFAAVTSFGVYFSMYAFRKPFTVGTFDGIQFLGFDYKIWLVSAQLIGYMLSKFYGIRFISGMQPEKRANTIVKLILLAWLSLLLFAITPAPYSIVFLLLNGFPLGMVWGLVFGFLEGRKATEFMGAVLSISFIFSSGVVKTVGKSILLNWHVSEFWMPFLAGGFFVLPMFLFTWLLNHIPPPDEKDIALRSVRKPMTKEERRSFISNFLPGIVIIVITYVLLTILRDFRDNFANELWTELGYGNNAAIFTVSETYVSLIVLACMSCLVLVKNNIRAFMINHVIIIAGYALALIVTILFMNQLVNPVIWITSIGTGLYLAYVPFNALYFERMIATYRIKSNVGFIMYIADAFGYLGSAFVLFLKEFIGVKLSWTAFFTDAVTIITVIGIIGTAIGAIYFKRKYNDLQDGLTLKYFIYIIY